MKLKHALLLLFTISILNNCRNPEVAENKKESPVDGKWAYQMVDPSIDDPEKPWSYSPKPTLVIGTPFSPSPVQVTYDGAIYTGEAELAFFYGETLNPITARQRTFFKGWIPIVQNSWQDDGLLYETEIFGTNVKGLEKTNSLQFAKVTVTNISDQSKEATVAAASRTSGLDHRYRGAVACPPDTKYVMNDNVFTRDGQLIYNYEKGETLYAVPDKTYRAPFTAADYQITQRAEVGVTKYNATLKSGEKAAWVFKMPRVPVPVKNTTAITAIKNADYNAYRKETISFWEGLVEKKVTFSIPEERVDHAYRAAMVHLILATREEEGRKRQGSGLPYDGLFLNDYSDMRLAYDVLGLYDYVNVNTPWLIEQQTESGMFIDKSLSHGQEILASHGQALFSMAHHYTMSQDKAYIKAAYPSIKKGVEWIENEHKTHENGLLRTSTPYDNEMIKGYYTSHNLWGILGLRSAINVARSLNKQEDVANWAALHETYLTAIKKAVKTSTKEGHYLPPGLYDYMIGEDARAGFKEYRTNQDWENMLLLYPTELLETKDPIVMGTLETIRKSKYREGVMTYRNGMHLHQYITYNQAQQYMAAGYYKRALTDFYHIMLHNGSVHEGFENLVDPWEDRDPDPSPSPHAWAAAKTVVFTRNMLVREYGGQAGLDPKERNLYLFSLLSPEWAKEGQYVEIKNAVTEMGDISAKIDFNSTGAEIVVQSNFHQFPQYIAIPTPYFKTFESFESNAKNYFEKDGMLYFSSEVSQITIKWKDKNLEEEYNYQDILKAYRSEPNIQWKGYDGLGSPKPAMQLMDGEAGELIAIEGEEGYLLDDEKNYPAEHLSFKLVEKTFKKEYKRRFEEYLKAGEKAIDVTPLKILTPEERKQLFEKKK
ncbi:hypothetical protein [Flavivirga spongiicola]|uniref:Uncharacterized protein n=1 Tax=Flavivirga spongiicola TaxID=421621 RepID=A0ABU7XU92_9FLAO|nr:hypothetical protein [Flavivirga sp. MEBiC05379]MDO5979004.1 hypothetical protein [Flavivirga sp. MEBiC05379]